MTQDHLDGLLTVFIKQELAYYINIDDVIDTFKSLTTIYIRIEGWSCKFYVYMLYLIFYIFKVIIISF